MRKLTQAVLAFAVTTLAGYDAYVYRTAGTEATISAVTRDAVVEFPIIGLALGVVVGHILWPLRERK